MASNQALSYQFFSELKKFNGTNFRTLYKADLTKEDSGVHKAFSSVVTRFFLFCEKHPDLSDVEKRFLYFKLKIDLIARYFADYPDTDLKQLVEFQQELHSYVKVTKDGVDDGVDSN